MADREGHRDPGVLVLAFGYAAKEPSPSRVVIGGFTAGAVVLVWARQALWQRFTHSAATRHSVVLFGARSQNHELRTLIDAHPQWGITIAGGLEPTGELTGPLVRLLHEHHVDTVIVSGARTSFDKLDELIQVCRARGRCLAVRRLRHHRGLAHVVRSVPRPADGAVPGEARSRGQQALAVAARPSISCCATIILVIGPLVMLPAAIAIRLGSRGPVLFRQDRCGKHGRRFTMYKFRSMVADAEAQRDALEDKNEQTGPVFKMRADPRITRVGRFIRKMSIDELPQLFNVLRGEMSIVETQPPTSPPRSHGTGGGNCRRMSMKPGLTCSSVAGDRPQQHRVRSLDAPRPRVHRSVVDCGKPSFGHPSHRTGGAQLGEPLT